MSAELKEKSLTSNEKLYITSELFDKTKQITDINYDLPVLSDSKENVIIVVEEDERFHPEKWKTFVAFAFYITSMLCALISRTIAHQLLPDRSLHPPLPDMFFKIFPHVEWSINITESIITLFIVWIVVIAVFHKYRYIVLRRIFVITGYIYLVRVITVLITQIPVPNTVHYCSPKINSTNPLLFAKRIFIMLSSFGLSINGQFAFCGDYIYSGHTTFLTLSCLIIKEYSPKKIAFLDQIATLCSCTGVFMILLSRSHYTVDVVVAYYIATRVFWIYHTIANNPQLKGPNKNNYLARIWWFTSLMYFEKNVNGVVPREVEWPFSWPRTFSRYTHIS